MLPFPGLAVGDGLDVEGKQLPVQQVLKHKQTTDMDYNIILAATNFNRLTRNSSTFEGTE